MGKNILRTDRLILIIAAILLVLPLTVSAEFITVDSITPNTDTNTSSVTSVTFTGTNFISGTDMPIVSGAIANDDFGLRYCTDFVTNSEIEAVCNFDLTGIPAGEYFVFVNDQVEASYGFLPFTVTSESEPTPTPTPTETIRALIINPSVESESFFCRIIYTKWICDLWGSGTGGMGPQGIPGINGTVGTGDTNYFNFTGSNLTTISNITNFYNSTISNFTVISNTTNFYNETFYNGTANQTDIDLTQFPFLNGTRALTGIWDFGGYNLSNLLDPVSPQDAATKHYCDSLASSAQKCGASTWLS
jgi:hypothetical protein